MQSLDFAESVRRAVLRAAIDAYEDAGIQGLCEEGRWEAAVSAMQALDVTLLTQNSTESPAADSPDR